MTKRQADTIIAGIFSILICQVLCTAVLLREQDRAKSQGMQSETVVQQRGASVTVPAETSASEPIKDRRAVAAEEITNFESGLAMYQSDTGHYPSQEIGMEVLVRNVGNETHWKGPYLHNTDMIRPDPWGHGYSYRAPPTRTGSDFLISSEGDGVPITSQTIK